MNSMKFKMQFYLFATVWIYQLIYFDGSDCRMMLRCKLSINSYYCDVSSLTKR